VPPGTSGVPDAPRLPFAAHVAELDSLPPDQRAALQLLLERGRTYDQLAEMLAIDSRAVRRRAHDALEALGPEAGRRLDPDRRAEVSDYLLGQQTEAEGAATRRHLADNPAARAWARSLVGVLRSLRPEGLPDIPDEGRAPKADSATERPAPYASAPPEEPRASRLGGALLLGGVALALIVVIIVLVTGGDDDDRRARAPSTTPTARTATQPTRPVAQINLLPPGGGRRPAGLAQVFARGQERAIIIAAQGLSSGAYALWLYNSRADARLLGFVPQRVGRGGRFATQGVLPAEAGRFRSLVVTRETVTPNTRRPPSRPGQVVLQGRLTLG
jgi:Sigma-70, region 4